MRSFDCLHRDCPIFGPHLLEASAGTGKTFSIEHVFVRLLLQSDGIETSQILAVTFTRAATRDLKKRIRANIQQALLRIETKEEGWDYLQPLLGSEKAKERLSDALFAFDQAQIFTIHGFCYRMLQQFAFEAKLKFALKDPELLKGPSSKLFREARKFLQTGIREELLCPEQMIWLYKEYDTRSALVRCLLKGKKETASPSFADLLSRFKEAVSTWKELFPALTQLVDEFSLISSSFKKRGANDFEKELLSLSQCQESPSHAFRQLLKERGSLFSFLSSENKKVKATVVVPPFFEWASQRLAPIIAEAMDRKKILGCLQRAWELIEAPILAEEQSVDPDEILKRMQTAIKEEAFASQIREKYKAVIIDEFQDTDPLQWQIFKDLFLNAKQPLRALYLVGDPKQSIYRFRSADVYTYFEAKETLGPDAWFCLDTNYRSSSPLISALNALFQRNWLPLPKIGGMIACPAVKAGKSDALAISDGKKAVHFLIGDSFEECLLPYTIAEIERLIPLFPSPASFAILVRDRYGMDLALRLCEMRSIPAIAKSNTSLSETLGFKAIQEFFASIASPKDMSLRRRVALGPLSDVSLSASRKVLEEGAFIALCRDISAASSAASLAKEVKEVMEVLLAWEGREGFSLEGLQRFLNDFAQLAPEEGSGRHIEAEKDAVQILTLHASKGLEFDVVFAIGLAVRPPAAEEDVAEIEAEKLRQLYVAMTRAKLRLYVPLPLDRPKGRNPFSAAEAFCQTLTSQEGEILSFLEKIETVSYEKLPSRISLAPLVLQGASQETAPFSSSPPAFAPSFLHSFTLSLSDFNTASTEE